MLLPPITGVWSSKSNFNTILTCHITAPNCLMPPMHTRLKQLFHNLISLYCTIKKVIHATQPACCYWTKCLKIISTDTVCYNYLIYMWTNSLKIF